MQAFLGIFPQSKPTRDGKTLSFFSKFHFEFLKIGLSLVKKKFWGDFCRFFIKTVHIQIEKKSLIEFFKLTIYGVFNKFA